ncbi:MAG: DNA-directed RNA polymerase subunit alpha C-terminal domain-containing protein, partial [Isosphaerales bacterium]
GVVVGLIPARLVRALKLPRNSSFESLDPVWVDVPRGSLDRHLLNQLTALVNPAIKSRRLDMTGLAFPDGVPPSVDLKRLPVSTRTRNCLKRASLSSTEALRGKSLGRLLEIPGFGVRCLVDLLTAVEGATQATDTDAAHVKGLAAGPPTELEAQWHGVTHHRGPRAIGGYGRRCLVPGALESVFRGTVPAPLVQALKLAPGTSFESVARGRVLVGERAADRQLLNWLAELLSRAITAGWLDLSGPAFPDGVASTIDLSRLPIHTRTWNCLMRERLVFAEELERRSLRELLAIPGFGLKCMVDLLTAVDGAHQPIETEGACPQTTELYELGPLTLAPRLTCEARLLAEEPWSKDVGVYDARLAPRLLTSDDPRREMQDAFAAGRLALEHPLLAEPPRYDIDLLRCPLSYQTARWLRQARLTKLTALMYLTPRDLLRTNGLGERSVSDLLVLLDIFRYFTPAAPPVGHEPALSDLCEAVVNRVRDCWFPEPLADRIARVRAFGIRCVSMALEDELSELAASASLAHKKLAFEFLGWDGHGPRTLEMAGAASGVTGERARQLVQRVKRRLALASSWTPTLIKALDLCRQLCPRPAEEIAVLLQQNALARVKFHPYGLVTAAQAVGLTPSVALERVGGAEWLITTPNAGSALAESAL